MTRKQIASLGVFIIGSITLVTGVAFLLINLLKPEEIPDGEYLVSAKNWVLDSSSDVTWDFTEVGKGKLTTNSHQNDYDFIWALDGNELKIETKWLYDMNNVYTYELNKDGGVLQLEDENGKYRFLATF